MRSAVRTSSTPSRPCHVIFFGETGSGKSSVINLLIGAKEAPVSNDAQPCTQTSACYEISLRDQKYCLWDTRGLGEACNFFFRVFLGRNSEKELKKFLKERHQKREINLLVYCVRGTRATKAMVENYEKFCVISRHLAAPVAIVVTHVERQRDWWEQNTSDLSKRGLDFDGHACITALLEPHPLATESKKKLVDLITKDYCWRPTESRSYFGSSPPTLHTQSAPPHHERSMLRNLFKPKYKDNTNEGSPHLRQRSVSGPSVTISSRKDSDYHSAISTPDSVPPSPTVVPPTPPTNPMDVLPINTHPVVINNPSQSSSEDISSIGSSPFSACSTSCHTLQSECFMEGIEGFLNDLNLPIKDLTSTVKRRISYSTQGGAFGDIWECDWLSGGSHRKVAVKAVKTKSDEIEKHLKKLRRELRIWCRLNHKNVVPLLGVVSDFAHLPSMVSPWYSNGSLHSYLTVHYMLCLTTRRRLLRDIAAGLDYLHSQDIIHGDLHSGNVLIDDGGTARLTDFGHSFIENFVGTSYLKSSICGHLVFADPALVERVYASWDIVYPTKACDVYSFGGLILHVLSGKTPYAEIPPASIYITILNGIPPQIPTEIIHEDAMFIQSCWDPAEHNRPSTVTLLAKLQQKP